VGRNNMYSQIFL